MTEILTRQSDDDRAVSPVIGVILMVAITVILAAVIGFFVLDLGSDTQSTPQASFTFDQDAGTITHDGGDAIDNANLYVVNDGSRTGWGGSSEVTAGDTSSAGTFTSDEIRVVYDDGESSATLSSYQPS